MKDDIKFFVNKIRNNITISDDEPNANVYHAERIFIHPLYQDKIGNYGSDIAIVQLIETIEFNDYIHPICIDWKLEKIVGHLKNGTIGLLTGMGVTENQRPSDVLRMVRLPVISDRRCIDFQNQDFRKYIRMTTFCAGWANGTVGYFLGTQIKHFYTNFTSILSNSRVFKIFQHIKNTLFRFH